MGPREHESTGPRVHTTTGPRAPKINRTLDSRPEIPLQVRSDIEDPCSQAVEGKKYTYMLA